MLRHIFVYEGKSALTVCILRKAGPLTVVNSKFVLNKSSFVICILGTNYLIGLGIKHAFNYLIVCDHVR